jgi:hypothetical protein
VLDDLVARGGDLEALAPQLFDETLGVDLHSHIVIIAPEAQISRG